MNLNEMEYGDTGLWIQVIDEGVLVGLGPTGQDEAGDVAFVELASEEENFQSGDVFLSVEGEKAVTEFTLPFAGKVVKWHLELEEEPEKLNSSNTSDTWVLLLTETSLSEEEIEKLKKDEKRD